MTGEVFSRDQVEKCLLVEGEFIQAISSGQFHRTIWLQIPCRMVLNPSVIETVCY